MLWLFAQMFLLCAVSFAAGSALTWWSQRPRAQSAPVVLPTPRPALVVKPVQLKGNSKTMVYHTPESPYYRRMKGDRTFASVDEAVAAGYRMWNTKATAKA